MHISIAAILVPALIQSDEHGLRFHPSEPARITKFVQSALDLELVSATTTQNGEDALYDSDFHRTGTTVKVRQTAVIADEFTQIADGFPHSFRRTFYRLELAAETLGLEPYRVEGALQGRTVGFDWGEKSKSWETKLIGEDDMPQEQLERLSADKDFLWLLPAEPSPPKGKRWEVASEDLLAALSPDGYPSFGYGDRKSSTGSWPSLHVAIVPPLPRSTRFWTQATDGRVIAEYKGRRTEDGDEVAVVAVTLDLRGARKPQELMRLVLSSMQRSDPEHAEVLPGYIEMLNYGGEGITWTLKGTAELLWSFEDGHFRSFELQADVHVRYDLTWRYDWEVPESSGLAGARRGDEITGARQEEWEGSLTMLSGLGAPEQDKKR